MRFLEQTLARVTLRGAQPLSTTSKPGYTLADAPKEIDIRGVNLLYCNQLLNMGRNNEVKLTGIICPTPEMFPLKFELHIAEYDKKAASAVMYLGIRGVNALDIQNENCQAI